jgi:hypothetical protein
MKYLLSNSLGKYYYVYFQNYSIASINKASINLYILFAMTASISE